MCPHTNRRHEPLGFGLLFVFSTRHTGDRSISNSAILSEVDGYSKNGKRIIVTNQMKKEYTLSKPKTNGRQDTPQSGAAVAEARRRPKYSDKQVVVVVVVVVLVVVVILVLIFVVVVVVVIVLVLVLVVIIVVVVVSSSNS